MDVGFILEVLNQTGPHLPIGTAEARVGSMSGRVRTVRFLKKDTRKLEKERSTALMLLGPHQEEGRWSSRSASFPLCDRQVFWK